MGDSISPWTHMTDERAYGSNYENLQLQWRAEISKNVPEREWWVRDGEWMFSSNEEGP